MRLSVALAALSGLCFFGCGAVDGPPPPIVLWVVDTLRADRLGLYGAENPVSPNYDALAERSTVFESAVAQSSWTRPTVATLLTGAGPIKHGVHRAEHSLGGEWRLLPERLGELGYATAGFTANGNVQEKFGFDRGFEEFWFHNRATAEQLVDRALGWLDGVRAEDPDRPFFVMILSIEPHDGYEPAEPFRVRFADGIDDVEVGTVEFVKQLRLKQRESSPDLVAQLLRLYDGEIAWNDHAFGKFRHQLEARGVNPVMVVIADHGEEFGEHGRYGHLSLYREVLDIPFLIHLPGQTEGRRVDAPVQQADIVPTLVDLAGGEIAEEVDGLSLVPLLRGSRRRFGGARPLVSVSLLTGEPVLELRPQYSLVLDEWKLVWTKPATVQLFDRVNDPGELVDLANEEPALTRRLLRILQDEVRRAELQAGESNEVALDEETRRQLRAMGYVE